MLTVPFVQVNAYVAPKPETTKAVNDWLSSHNISAKRSNKAGNWVSIDVPVHKANKLLDTDFTTFTHVATGKRSIRALSYSIPEDLRAHIDLVHPTVLYVICLQLCQPSTK